jgi:hypothetical protein
MDKSRASQSLRPSPSTRTSKTWSELNAGSSLRARVASLYAKEYVPGKEAGTKDRYGRIRSEGVTSDASDVRRGLSTFFGIGTAAFAGTFLIIGELVAGFSLLAAFALVAAAMPTRVLLKSRALSRSTRLSPTGASLVSDFDEVIAACVDLAARSDGLTHVSATDLTATLLAERARLLSALTASLADLEDGSRDPARSALVEDRVRAATESAQAAVADLTAALVSTGDFIGGDLIDHALGLVSASDEALGRAREATTHVRDSFAELTDRHQSPHTISS